MITRRQFLKLSTVTGTGLLIPRQWYSFHGLAAPDAPEAILDPLTIPKYETQLIVPPAMPRVGEIALPDGTMADYYEITMKQFTEYILPPSMGLNATVVWSYVKADDPSTFNYPAFTIEAQWNKPVRVKWINGLVDGSGNYLPHLFWIDQSVHWANPPGPPDMEAPVQAPYLGPVPMATHVHGAHTTEESDGYPEAWYLPNANNIPADYFASGSLFEEFKTKFQAQWGVTWDPGTPQGLCRAGRLLSCPWRPGRPAFRDTSRPRARDRRRSLWHVLRDPDRDPGPLF
jgi:spore coat protein A